MQKQLNGVAKTDFFLILLIAVQPLLDAAAYWSYGLPVTFSGYIRLALLIFIPVFILFYTDEKKKYYVSMCCIAFIFLPHIFNCFRIGYSSIFTDFQYILRVAQMPVFTVCFIFYIRKNKSADWMKKGLKIAVCVYILLLIISVITGTWNSTYGDGIGFSGWVTNDNRCANSIILVFFSVFAITTGVSQRRPALLFICYLVPAILLILNGTKACYYALLAIGFAFACFETLRFFICRNDFSIFRLCIPMVLIIVSIIIYPYTPRAREDGVEAENNSSEAFTEFCEGVAAAGYDIKTVSMDDIIQSEELLGVYELYYKKMICGGIPQMFDDFDTVSILNAYNLTYDVEKLMDVRVMKRTYAKLAFNESDLATRISGFEIYRMGMENPLDMENDWPALFYYYGYIGFTTYALFILFFIIRVFRKIVFSLKDSLTPINFGLFVCLILLLGLAQFSGAVLRRPNVSIFLSLVLACIYYQTITARTD